jgi:hypothetical protein
MIRTIRFVFSLSPETIHTSVTHLHQKTAVSSSPSPMSLASLVVPHSNRTSWFTSSGAGSVKSRPVTASDFRPRRTSVLSHSRSGEKMKDTPKGKDSVDSSAEGSNSTSYGQLMSMGALHFASHHFLSCQTTLQPKQVLPFHPKRTVREVPLESAQCPLRSPRNAEASSSLLLTC